MTDPKLNLSTLMDEFEKQMAVIAELQTQRANMIASAQAGGKRVTITVNAEGVVVDARFAPDIDELSYGEIAAAVVEATQAAAVKVKKMTADLVNPHIGMRDRLPTISDIVEGMPNLRNHIPVPPEVSTAPPTEQQLRESDAEFGDAEEYDAKPTGRTVTETEW